MKLEQLISLPAILVGGGMLYVGYFESDVIYLFFYSLLGASLALIGVLLLLGYDITPSKKVKQELKPAASGGEVTRDTEDRPKPLEHCPNCGAPLVSAGKFCGSCGSPIKTGGH